MTEAIKNEILARYEAKTPTSKKLHTQASEFLPGGDTRAAIYFTPYPIYMERGDGCLISDYDGNTYLDFHNNYTSLIHGHNHGPTVRATQEQLVKGTVLGALSKAIIHHAEILRGRLPSLERLRYCNSGTEATMFAMRVARAFTGRNLIVKMDGGYHGTHDYVEVNMMPDMNPAPRPKRQASSPGVPQAVVEQMLIAPFNDLAAMEQILIENKGQVAAIITEPMLGAGGNIAPLPGYLKGLRDLADRYDILLIFDEIITFRTSLGGMQEIEGLRPDLTTLGKIIGGGLPVGAFGGRRDIMSIFDPNNEQGIHHSGTFNGNHLTMTAGIATLESYDQAAVAHVNRLGARLRDGFNDAFKEAGIRGQTTGIGSLCDVHWSDVSLTNAPQSQQVIQDARDLPKLLHLEMLAQGVFFPRRGQFCVSTAMTEHQVDQAIEVFNNSLHILKPLVAEMNL
jgi:glutamate-1-semialdehyde 2,1-aminomutase